MKKILSTALVCALLAGCGGGGGSTPPVIAGPQSSGTAHATLNFKFNTQSSISGQARGRKYISRNTLGLGISYRPTGGSALGSGPLPSLSTVAGASTSGAIDVEITYVNQFGQSAASASSTSTPTAAQQVQVAAPGPGGNATGYNVYARLSGVGTYYLQNTSPIAVTSTYKVPGALVASGAAAPAVDTTAGAFGATEAALRAPNWATVIGPGVNANLTECTAADTTPGPTFGSFSCSVVISVPAGYNDFQITTWDAAPVSLGTGGTFGASANDLSTATISNQYVQVNQNNVFNYALNGVVNSVVLQLSTQSLVAGATLGQLSNGTPINPSSVTLAVLAKDYDGNIIIGGDPYVDVNGTPVTVNVSKNESYPTVVGNAAPASGNVTFTTASVTGTGNACVGGPTQTCTFVTPGSVPINYNGYDINSATFSANVTGGVAVATFPAAISFTRTVNGGGGGITVPPALTLNIYGPGATACAPAAGPMDGGRGPDGNVYFAEPCGKILQVTPAGVVNELNAPGSTPNAVIAGPDNELWILDQGSNQIARMKTDGTNGATFPGPLPAVQMAGSLPQGITLGTDDRLWFTENTGGYIGVMNPDGTIFNQFNVGGSPDKIAVGPGGYWYTDVNNAQIVQMNAAGTKLQTLTGAIITSGTNDNNNACSVGSPCSVQSPQGIAQGPDGNMWVADFSAGILKITPGGSVTVYRVPAGSPQAITAGADGNMWFTILNATATQNGVGRVTSSGAVTTYTDPGLPVSNTLGIVSGGDGNIWFSNYTGGTITKVNL